MTDAEIKAIIRFVADKAWTIAFDAESPAQVCLDIEALSDDPSTVTRLVSEIKDRLPVSDGEGLGSRRQ
jgi:hypothetical protein